MFVLAATNRLVAQEKSVKPGINKVFEDPDVASFVGRFEREGRDAYDHRHEIVKACKLKPDMVVADIGAGTGLFTRMFSPVVGSQGRVYAVDISEKFLKHIETTAKDEGLTNITGVVCRQDSVNLPPNSIDVAFLCDTYHHFEFPHKTMRSIHRALRPGGQVILIDFHRIEGVTREWLMNHVRARQEAFTKEILESGFRQMDEKKDMLDESYFVRFEKAELVQSKNDGKTSSTKVMARSFCNVMDHGAAGDGKSKDTQAIQQAIDACYRKGGGTVYFPAGVYLSGSLHIKNHVTIHLDNGATLLASPDDADFDPFEKLDFKNDSDEETSYFHFSLIWAEDVSNIAITGLGTIDSNRQSREGPKTIGFKRCRNVTIKDITIRNAGNYCISLLGTDYVNIDGVSIFRSFCDGIDPDCCHHVSISNCHIETWDDAIVPKTSFSLGYDRSTEFVTVTNCVLATNRNGFKLGTESRGDFRHITVSNCVVTPYTSKVNRQPGSKPISGIALISADGAHIEDVTITNISMKEVLFPIFMQLSNRGRDRDKPVPGTIKKVMISNVTVSHALVACIIDGLPKHPIQDIHLDNIKANCFGGGTKVEKKSEVSEMIGQYPSADKYRDVSTCGLFLRHVAGLKLEDFQLSVETPDFRHAMICDDVEDLMIESFKSPSAVGGASPIHFDSVRDALIRGCRPKRGAAVFLRVSGERTNGIALINNDFTRVEQSVVRGEGVPTERVRSEFNVE